MEFVSEVETAAGRVGPHIRETWLVHSPVFSQLAKANVYLKLENLQHTGSFKVRGALNKMLCLTSEERTRDVVTASSGNHGAAVAFAMQIANAKGTIFVPENASPAKIRNIERFGTQLRYHGFDSSHTEVAARAYAEEHSQVYIPPYNDRQVIAGQGSIALEMLKQLPSLDAAVISIGGGGLISGISAYLKAMNPNIKVVGVSPAASQVMIQSVRAGQILELPSEPTLSDGTAGGVEAGAMTFEMIQAYVDELVTVSEPEIANAMREFMSAHQMLIEGAAGVALAGLTVCGRKLEGKNIVVVVCGANISLPVLKSIL